MAFASVCRVLFYLVRRGDVIVVAKSSNRTIHYQLRRDRMDNGLVIDIVTLAYFEKVSEQRSCKT